MGLWAFYFIAKLYLHGAGYIELHLAWNLAFAAFLAWPLLARWSRVLRQFIAVPLGLLLLHHDSWLPPISRLFDTADDLAQFSFGYLLELLGRFINPKVLIILAAMFVPYWLLSRRLRMGSFAVLGLLSVGLYGGLSEIRWPVGGRAPAVAVAGGPEGSLPVAAAAAPVLGPATDDNLEAALDAFYRQESRRQVQFSPVPAEATPFDIVVVHICSLAWDDMDYVGSRDHPFMNRLDVRFDRFSTAASYSGPGAIRLLRGTCGQGDHASLYREAGPGCLLFERLEASGFELSVLLNHDGHFGNFLGDLRDRGGLDETPIDNRSAKVAMHAFDGSPIYDDEALLARWWQMRQQSQAPRAALYYNTVSLHDGNRIVGRGGLSVKESFRVRLDGLFASLDRFADTVRQSGRRVVMVLVPEHGANVRGDRMQISGLREIPSPSIALAPVGVQLIEAGRDVPARIDVDVPTSYFALSTLLSRMIAGDPFSPDALEREARDLPQTPFVAENEGTVVMRYGSEFHLRDPGGKWTEYRQ